MINKKMLILTVVLSFSLLMTGCSGVMSTSGDGGELALSLADAPVNDVENVWVTLDRVEVHNEETGWQTINDFDVDNGEGKFDLLQLRFDEELLGQEMLPTGTYTQIRLIVAAAEKGASTGINSGKSYVVYTDGTEDDIFIPSGTQTGLKINHEFAIEDGKITRLLLDADVSKIMHTAGKSGKIILRPTAIDIIDQVVSGDIEGNVLADTDGDSTTDPIAITDYDVVVEAYEQGATEPVKSTVATTKESTLEDGTVKPAGSFKLRGLEAGTYTIKTKVVTGEDTDNDGNPDELMIDTDGDETKDTPQYQQTQEVTIDVVAEEITTLENDIVLEKNEVQTSTTN